MNVVLRERSTQLRYTDALGLAALIQGGILSAMETLLEYQIHFTDSVAGAPHPRSNIFVLRVADEIAPLADFLYTVELRRFPSDFHGERAEVLRPWITVHHADGLSGWPDDVLMLITGAAADIPA